MYKEYSPDELLSPYIDKYWVSKGKIPGNGNMIIPADGCVDIIFAWGSSAFDRSMQECYPYIVGTMETFSSEMFRHEVDMLGIRFKPLGITAFIKTPVNELTNLKTELNQIESIFCDDLHLPLQALYNSYNILKHIDNYLIQKLFSVYKQDERILFCVNEIITNKGLLSTTQLSEKSCLSKRQFERIFKHSLGISAKTFSKIERMKHTKTYLKSNPGISIFNAAIDCGYYDHSHLIKDFKELSGQLPSYYI